MRGLNASSKGLAVSQYCSDHLVSLLGLLETKVPSTREDRVRGLLPFQWEHVTNCLPGERGRIWVTWNLRVFKVEVLRISSQVVTCSVESVDGKFSFMASFVYVVNEVEGRIELWEEL